MRHPGGGQGGGPPSPHAKRLWLGKRIESGAGEKVGKIGRVGKIGYTNIGKISIGDGRPGRKLIWCADDLWFPHAQKKRGRTAPPISDRGTAGPLRPVPAQLVYSVALIHTVGTVQL